MKVIRWVLVIVLVAVAAALLIVYWPKLIQLGRQRCGRRSADAESESRRVEPTS